MFRLHHRILSLLIYQFTPFALILTAEAVLHLQRRKFHFAASSASEPKRKPVPANSLIPTHTNTKSDLVADAQTCSCFGCFVAHLAKKAPKHCPRSRIRVLPRCTEVVGKTESWRRSLLRRNLRPAEPGPAIFQMRRGQKGPIPNPPLFSWVSRIKSARANMGQNA